MAEKTNLEKFADSQSNKFLKDRLKVLLANTRKLNDKRTTGPAHNFLKPEDIKKGITAFDIVDLKHNQVLVPKGTTLNPDEMELLKQLTRMAPKALYMNMKTDKDVKFSWPDNGGIVKEAVSSPEDITVRRDLVREITKLDQTFNSYEREEAALIAWNNLVEKEMRRGNYYNYYGFINYVPITTLQRLLNNGQALLDKYAPIKEDYKNKEKYPKIIDFSYAHGEKSFGPETKEYQALEDLSSISDDW